SSENVDNSDINKEIDSDISESESAEGIILQLTLIKIKTSENLSWLIIYKRQHEKKSASSKLWNNENGCKKMDVQVEYNSWDPYLERVVYILKDYKF
ncbi:12378_t:CDS:2, partial [Dentiscutata erythropus]